MTDQDRPCDKSMTEENRDSYVKRFVIWLSMTKENLDCNAKHYIEGYVTDANVFLSGLTLVVIFYFYVIFLNVVMAGPTHIDVRQLHIREDSSNSPNPNTSIVMYLEFEDPRYSDDLSITLYCASSAIGYCAVPGFDKGSGMAYREAVVVPRGPSWDDAQQKLAQGSSVELRVEITTNYIGSKKCRHCLEREKSHCSDCPAPTPVKEVAAFLLDGSVKVLRIS